MSGCCKDSNGLSGISECIASAINCVNSSLCSSDLRPYKVYVVIVSWSGDSVGDGQSSSAETEILPRPKITGWDDISIEVDDEGRYEVGSLNMQVTISTNKSLLLPNLKRNQEFYYDVVSEDGARRRFFPGSPPEREPMSMYYNIEIRRLRSDSLPDGTIHDEIPMFMPRP